MAEGIRKAFPVLAKELRSITCMVRGKVTLNLRSISYLQEIATDNEVTTQITMVDGPSYYIAGKTMHEVADDLDIVLEPYKVTQPS